MRTYITLERLKGYALIHGVYSWKPNTPWAVEIKSAMDDPRGIQAEAQKIAGTPAYFESTAVRGARS